MYRLLWDKIGSLQIQLHSQYLLNIPFIILCAIIDVEEKSIKKCTNDYGTK